MKRSLSSSGSLSSGSKRAKGLDKGRPSWAPPKTTVWVEIPAKPKRSTATKRHEFTGSELDEDGDLRIIGEVGPDEEDGDDDGDEGVDDEVPIRTLDAFSFFDAATLEFVSSSQLLSTSIPRGIRGAGMVRSYAEDDDLEDFDTDGQAVRLSPLLECSVHWVEGDGFDRKIYIRTAYAWYILLQPASAYASYHQSLLKHHYMAQMFLDQVIVDPEFTENALLDCLNDNIEELDPPFPRFSGQVRSRDFDSPDFVSYITTVLKNLAGQHYDVYQQVMNSGLRNALWPYMAVVLPSSRSSSPSFIPSEQLSPSPTPSAQPSSPSRTLSERSSIPPSSARSSQPRYRRLNDLEKDVLQHADPTVVTTRVGTIARRLFPQSLRTIDMSADDLQTRLPNPIAQAVHPSDLTSVVWIDGTEDPHIYRTVEIEGVVYRAGDIVLVIPGEDCDKSRSKNYVSSESRCHTNDLANTKWFCKINYFFEKKVRGSWEKFFHAQWLEHGSKTLLQETAHSRALFWLNECADLPLDCVYSHCNVHSLSAGEVEPCDDDSGEENSFFTGLTLDKHTHAFIRLSSEEMDTALAHCDKLKPCIPCGLSLQQELKEAWVSLPQDDGYSHLEVDYHVNDFIYIHHSAGLLLDIAQIVEFVCDDGNLVGLTVKSYGRYDHLVKSYTAQEYPRDNRRLFQTDVCTFVSLDVVEGKAFVACPTSLRDKEAWVQRDDHFYCDLHAKTLDSESAEVLHPTALPQCQQCNTMDVNEHVEDQILLSTHQKLRGLELFAGAGGLSTGLERAGFVETKWAVEFSPSAVKTFKANHPGAVVYNQSSNCLLEHAINTAEGRNPAPLWSTCGKELLPPMPQRDEVDFIFGGPPCQSFSIMNHHRKPDDVRSTLVCNMISYVDFYRPKYFLLENVLGLLSYKLIRRGLGKNSKKDFKMGVVKFIFRALIALGYQVHVRVIQAGQHGAPQGRRRVIFLAARGDVPLPSFPIPQFAYPKPLHTFNLPNIDQLYPTYRSVIGEEGHQCAALPAVTINEAIGDLPMFDWINPHLLIHQTQKDIGEVQRRTTQGIAQFRAVSQGLTQLPGYIEPVAYPYPPLSRYQMWLREDNGEMVKQHYTRSFGAGVVERVCFVPMHSTREGGPNHIDLPSRLHTARHYHPGTKEPRSNYSTIYGRLLGDAHFVTAMTVICPASKGGRVIHPHQKRVLTIRECARAQGFPDNYIFCSTKQKPSAQIQDEMRQIGNAVPVPLAWALGKEIGKAVVRHWKGEQQADREQSPEIA